MSRVLASTRSPPNTTAPGCSGLSTRSARSLQGHTKLLLGNLEKSLPVSAAADVSMRRTRDAGDCTQSCLVELSASCLARGQDKNALHQSLLQVAFNVACHLVPVLMMMGEVQI